MVRGEQCGFTAIRWLKQQCQVNILKDTGKRIAILFYWKMLKYVTTKQALMAISFERSYFYSG